MKKLLITILIITFVAGSLGILFAPSHTLAQTSPEVKCRQLGYKPGELSWDICIERYSNPGEEVDIDKFISDRAVADAAAREVEAVRSPNCDGIFAEFGFDCFLEKTSNKALNLSSWLVYFSGQLFDFTIQKTVIGMSDLMEESDISNEEGTGVVDVGWKVFRDFVNIFFIFILLYISISVILGLGVNIKSLLIRIILIALLINFSLFITKIIIDTSNLLATGFYKTTLETAEGFARVRAGGDTDDDDSSPRSFGGSISEMFVDRLNLATIYNPLDVDENGQPIQVNLSSSNIITIGLYGSLFMLVVAFVFLAGAILFALRFITFIFLMILAPLAFFGMILPKTQPYANKWWGALLGQVYFAPIYMALIFVVIKGMSTFTIAGSGSADETLAAAFSADASANFSIVLNFIIFMGLIIGALIIAKELGVRGADTTIKMGTDVRKWGQAKVAGAPSAALRQTAGRAADYVARDERSVIGTRLKDLSTSKNLFIRKVGETGLRGAQKTAGARFGVANLPGASAKVGKGGFKKGFEDKVKKERDFAKGLGTPQGTLQRTAELTTKIEDYKKNIETKKGTEREALKKGLIIAERELVELKAPEKQKERQLDRAGAISQRRIIPRSTLGRKPSTFATEAAREIKADIKEGKGMKNLRKMINEMEKGNKKDDEGEEKKEGKAE